jgi:membrane-associated phospholipid phosphatase
VSIAWDRSPGRSFVTAAGAAAALVSLYSLAVWTAVGQSLDQQLMLAFATWLRGAEWTETVLWVVSPALVIYLTLVVGTAAVILRGGQAAVRSVVTIAATVGTAEVLKSLLHRPAWLDDAANSLPSGHVAAVAAIITGAVLAVPDRLRHVVGGAGGAAVMVTGVATMAEEWHRPSDVVAAVLLAVLVGSLAVCYPDPTAPTSVGGSDRGARGHSVPL